MDKRRICEVTDRVDIAPDTVKLSFLFGDDDGILPGRFVHIAPIGRPDLPLRRPFGINGYNKSNGKMDIICQVVGKGSAAIASATNGDLLDVFGPAGNGFPQPAADTWLVGGGMGCSPLNYLPEYYQDTDFTAIYGFRDADHIYQLQQMRSACKEVVLLTDDGSAGQKGFVTTALQSMLRDGRRPGCIMACGPMAMLKGLSEVLRQQGCMDIPCFVSLEQRMGCGMGACYTCTCDTLTNGRHSNARVCMEGPVFHMEEVLIRG